MQPVGDHGQAVPTYVQVRRQLHDAERHGGEGRQQIRRRRCCRNRDGALRRPISLGALEEGVRRNGRGLCQADWQDVGGVTGRDPAEGERKGSPPQDGSRTEKELRSSTHEVGKHERAEANTDVPRGRRDSDTHHRGGG